MPDNAFRVRPPHFADDRWYNSDSLQLEQEIQGYFVAAPTHPPDLLGLLAPHAGYFFSGHVAGAAFGGLTANSVETVILIGPDHRGAAPGEVSTAQVDAWRTPLGDVPVNWELLQAVQADLSLVLLPADEEHSLEVELPFLQMALHHFQIVPLLMSDASPQMCRRLADALVKAIRQHAFGEGILLVASSDLSHYFDDDTARRLDQTTLDFILTLDADGLMQHVEAGHRQRQPFACGAGPIATIIHAATALGATQATLLKYATSADAHPHKDRVVGYAAIAISQ